MSTSTERAAALRRFADDIEAEDMELEEAFEHDEDTAVLGQFYLEGGSLNLAEDGEDEGIWKTVLRTGKWKLRPGTAGVPIRKPLVVVRDGQVGKGQVSMQQLVEAFEEGAVEHVTIPLSHSDRVDENTGLVKALRIIDEGDGSKLQAKFAFSEPDIEKRVKNGSILNSSVGVLFDFVRKSDGKKFPQALGHVALTNKPWIDGMEPFGQLAASDDVSTQLSATYDDTEGGDTRMENIELDDDTVVMVEGLSLSDLGVDSVEELQDKLGQVDSLQAKLHDREVRENAERWQTEGVPPAVVEEARLIMSADDGGPALMLSQDGNNTTITATEIVERIVAKVPRLELSHDGGTEGASRRPNDDASLELSHDQQVERAEAFLEGKKWVPATTE